MTEGRPNNVTPFPDRRRPPGPVGRSGGPGNAPRLVDDPKLMVLMVYGATVAAFAMSLMAGRSPGWAGMVFGLVGMLLGLSAVIVSASRRETGPAWTRSHMEFVLRTVVIGGVSWVAAMLVTQIPFLGPQLGFLLFPALAAVSIWVAVRAFVGVWAAAGGRALGQPKTLWI